MLILSPDIGPFANYLQVACHKVKAKEETYADRSSDSNSSDVF